MESKESRVNILAGITTYNPDITRLTENLDAVCNQVDKVLIFDNNSENINELESLIKEFSTEIKLIKSKKNIGVAGALSEIMEVAKTENFSWVLTLDQDSVTMPNLCDEYRKYIHNSKDCGMFTCLIKDRNFSDKKYEIQKEEIKDVKFCITAGALTNTRAYFETSGYDKDFFIDAVDFDICYSLRENGKKIKRINYLGLLQEVSKGENRKFFFKDIVVYHQDPWRIFYLSRNLKKLYKKHPQSFSFFTLIKKEMSLFTKILLYENKKMTKLKHFFKGLLA